MTARIPSSEGSQGRPARAEWAHCVARLREISDNYKALTALLLDAVAENRRVLASTEKRLARLEHVLLGKPD